VWDNFSAEDLAAAGAVRLRRLSLLGVGA